METWKETELQVSKARLDWVRSKLSLSLWTKDEIAMVTKALEGLYKSNVRVSEAILVGRFAKIKPLSDTQSELDRADLAMAATKVVTAFDILEEMDRTGFYRNARLPEDLLIEHNLFDYIEAARNSIGTASDLLGWLTQLQEPPERAGDPNLYACLIASSGTGKTQLAATAALKYNKATCIYLCMAQGESQQFYRPHVSSFGAVAFKDAISEFLMSTGNLENAHQIASWADTGDKGSSLLVRMLHHLLLGTSFLPLNHNPIKLSHLKKIINSRKKKYLVFIDEVPPKHSSQFRNALCLRDIFRFLGIAPVLMSTHTGAQDYVGECSRSSVDIWTWVVSRLPRYAPFVANRQTILTETERPFVLALATRKLNTAASSFKLRDFIRDLQSTLQAQKPAAWINPALQLVQLFSTDVEIQGKFFASAHKLVGHHFGCLLQDEIIGRQKYTYLDAQHFGNNLVVAPVCSKTEPLLYLALTTWREDLLWEQNSSGIKFPLSDDQKQPLTVRGAFLRCKNNFTSDASTENPLAAKADGNLLEVLVHASLTLASLRVSAKEGEFLPGLNLKEFLPFVRTLMLPERMLERPKLPDFFAKLEYQWPDIPALCGSNSGLPDSFAKNNAIKLGRLERPPDKERVDGIVSIVPLDTGHPVPLISVECKNYSGEGVPAYELKEVFKRIPAGVTCSLVYVSRIQDGAFFRTKLATLKQCFEDNHATDSVSVVVWEASKTPKFLQTGREEFKAKGETKLLVVIISVGYIDASVNRKRRHLLISCANA